ncbi:hypothetical protein CKAN_02589300 [Cinnamomum micranthum f. kanehirae]|uniref:Uncharacterized protein n=1 Tax=Cinnamomum micranthum f. kanehirae TaxID=337451 RepID=A0A3S3N5W5_9MAGN|nr:hypothetical protein CKAN_02589300 [Cinnamomum micranthum f. kanehirae]
MESIRAWCVILCFFYSSLSSYGNGNGSSNLSRDSLDDLIRDYAFKELERSHTGVLNTVPIPANFSGVEASAARIRSSTFWSRGANFSDFYIPPGSIPLPFVRRIGLVYQNLANWSSSYYNVPGYSLVTPVVGFMAYDASNSYSSSKTNITALDLQVINDAIAISFPSLQKPKGLDLRMKCVRFDVGGSMEFSDMKFPNLCLTRGPGHFSIVVPSNAPGPSAAHAPSPTKLKRKGTKLKVWVVAVVCGVVGSALVGLIGVAVIKFVKQKKIQEMERQAEEGEALESVWVGGSRMPKATAIRTQTVLENENAP